MTIIWCMVPELSSATDRIFCHVGLFFILLSPPLHQPRKLKFNKNEKKSSRYYHFTHGYHKWKSWCMIPEEHNRHIFFSFWTIFCPFIPPSRPKNPKNQNFAKMQRKNACRYHHFTQVYHKWQSHDIWWFLRYEAQQIFLSFWAIFCPFTQLTTQKIKILKKWKKKKKHLEVSLFYTSGTKNHDHMLYCSWDMGHDRCNFYISFWIIFYPFTTLC